MFSRLIFFPLGSWRSSFIVSQYGRSFRDKSSVFIDSQDQLYNFQTFAGAKTRYTTSLEPLQVLLVGL